MKQTLILTALLAAAAFVQAGPREAFGNGELPEIMKPYDVDGDGKLNAEERQAFHKAARDKRKAALLEKFDTDGDGKLSEEELKAAREAARAKLIEERTNHFNDLDENEDGSLDATEFAPPGNLPAELVARIFNHLDKDDNNLISLEEFLAGCRPPRVGYSGGWQRPGDGTPPPPPPVGP